MPTSMEAQPEAAVSDERQPIPLDEQQVVAGYRAMDTVRKLATRCYLGTGDDRLVVAIYHQVFLGLRPGQLRRQTADDLREFTTPIEVEESPLVRG